MAIVFAAAMWDPAWSRRCICFRTNNMAVVDVLQSRTSCDPLLIHLLRCMPHHISLISLQLTYRVHITWQQMPSLEIIWLFLSLSLSRPRPMHGQSCSNFPWHGHLPSHTLRLWTHSVYTSGWKKNCQFCHRHSHPTLPLSKKVLCECAAVMVQSVSWLIGVGTAGAAPPPPPPPPPLLFCTE